MSAQHVRIASLGSLAAAVPVFIEIAVTSAWWNRLPDRIATTFGTDGSASGYGTPLGTATLLAAVQTPFSSRRSDLPSLEIGEKVGSPAR